MFPIDFEVNGEQIRLELHSTRTNIISAEGGQLGWSLTEGETHVYLTDDGVARFSQVPEHPSLYLPPSSSLNLEFEGELEGDAPQLWLLIYLPPYSPDFHPIELAFAKLKTLLRAAAARTVPELWEAIAAALDAFAPAECANYFAAAGYDAA